MGTNVEEIITRYSADASGYIKGTQHAIGATKALAKNMAQVEAAAPRMFKAIGHAAHSSRAGAGRSGGIASILGNMDIDPGQLLQGALSGIVQVGERAIQVFFSLAGAEAALGVASMNKAAEYEALIESLEAVEGSSERAAASMKKLREIAKLPGLEMLSAAVGYKGLRLSKIDENLAFDLTKQFGNANALAGGGSEEFSRIMRALTQISNAPFLQGDELQQLTEAGIPAYSIIKDAFGTIDTEELKRQGISAKMVLHALSEVLARYPRVGDSAKNAFENLASAMDQGMVAIGTALNTALLPRINEVTNIIGEMVEGGAISRTWQDIASMIESVLGDRKTDEILYDILAETKTIAGGMRNLILNAEGAADMAGKIIDFLGPFAPGFDAAKNLITGGAPSLPEERQSNLSEAEMERQLSEIRRKKKAQESPTDGEPVPVKDSPAWAPIVETARNTRAMVDLQKRSVDMQRIILGGSGTSHISPVELVGIRRGSRPQTLREAINYLVAAVEQQTNGAVMQGMLSRARMSR